MKKTTSSLLAVAMISFLGAHSSVADEKPKFSSAYTDFKKDCSSGEANEGEDAPMTCKGPGGYQIYFNFFGAGVNLVAQNEKEGFSADIANQPPSFGENGGKAEWRLANGKPFAIILRVTEYDEKAAAKDGDIAFQTKYKKGEVLVVKGLKGHGNIDFKVSTRKPKANEEAARLADQGFLKSN